MKSKLLMLITVLCALIFLPSCQTLDGVKQMEPAKLAALVKPAASVGGKELARYVIKSADTSEKKSEYASLLRASALGLRALTAKPGEAPTEAEVKRVILDLDPDNKYADLWPGVATSVASLYGAFSASFPDEAQLAMGILNELARGIEQGLSVSGYAMLPQDSIMMHPAWRICRGSTDLLLHFRVMGTQPQLDHA